MKMFEALWFVDHDDVIEDCFSKTFQTKKQVLDFYHNHKNDADKYGWFVSKRDYKWIPVEIYIGEVDFSN